MKCIKCREENINKANYCKTCAYHFSEAEQKAAKRRTLVGKLEMFEKAYNVCTLKVITDHIVFKIVSLLIVVGIGVSFYFNYGNKVKILESDNYQIQYNTKLKEYYLLINEDETTLDLYKPNNVKDLAVIHMGKDNEKINTIFYKENEKITLSANEVDDYYLLKTNNLKKETEIMKFYVFRKDSSNE